MLFAFSITSKSHKVYGRPVHACPGQNCFPSVGPADPNLPSALSTKNRLSYRSDSVTSVLKHQSFHLGGQQNSGCLIGPQQQLLTDWLSNGSGTAAGQDA
jgi:hypothetical protein